MTEEKTDQHGEKPAAPEGKRNHDLLESAAQAIGSTLGSIAVKTGLAKPSANGGPHPQRAETPEARPPEPADMNTPESKDAKGAHAHRSGPKRRKSRKKKPARAID